jgi:hypothetical protein
MRRSCGFISNSNSNVIQLTLMKRGLIRVLAFFVVGSALGQSTEPAKIRITTWNLEWFPNGSPHEAPFEKTGAMYVGCA